MTAFIFDAARVPASARRPFLASSEALASEDALAWDSLESFAEASFPKQ